MSVRCILQPDSAEGVFRMSTQHSEARTQISIGTLRRMKKEGEKFACLTAYDATFARVLDAAGVELILVGDSLGMVIQGHDSTIPVTVDDVIYHSRAVARGCRRALLMADMPFMSFASSQRAFDNAARLMGEGLAHMIKLEGGAAQVETVRLLADQGVPVCAHMGLRPQTVFRLGGYKVQGREKEAARAMLEDARKLEAAGAEVLRLGCVPSALGREITQTLAIPVIGIGAGPHCDGQILVLHDMLGITPGKPLRFTRNFLAGADGVGAAVADFVRAVKAEEFPAPEHCFN